MGGEEGRGRKAMRCVTSNDFGCCHGDAAALLRRSRSLARLWALGTGSVSDVVDGDEERVDGCCDIDR
jgi:hypothetical protein